MVSVTLRINGRLNESLLALAKLVEEVEAQGTRITIDKFQFDNAHLGTPIEELTLSPRVYNALRRDGIATLGDIVQLSETDIVDKRQMGPKQLEEIKETVSRYDLQLRTQ